jgi:hypothetical protein
MPSSCTEMRKLFLIVGLLMLATSAFAVGGSCPTGANYLSDTNPGGPLVTLATLGVTSCYYVAANGLDSNDGLSEVAGHPFLHAPGMPNCTGNCATASSGAGIGVIVRGGDTYHFGNSGLTPYTGGTWALKTSGTAGNYTYVGVDQTWFTGGSWTRPLMTQDNATSTSTVGSCSFSTGANNVMWQAGSRAYFILDNFEWTGFCWNSKTFGNNIVIKWFGPSSSVQPQIIENNYVHGWTRTAAGKQSGGSALAGHNGSPGSQIQFNVIDGADSDPLTMDPFSEGGDGYIVQYNIVRNVGGTTVFNVCHIHHDNLYEHYNNSNDGSTHTDVDFCFSEFTGGSSAPNLFYNNEYRFIGTDFGQSVSYVLANDTPHLQTDYVFNNKTHDNQPGGGNGSMVTDDNGCGASCDGVTLYFNNTGSKHTSGGSASCIVGPGANGTQVSANNFWVSDVGTQADVWCKTANLTETTALYETTTVANANGYTSGNDFSPTSSSSPTVTAAGANETLVYCTFAVLGDTNAVNACKAGTTNACTYDSTNHKPTCPNQPSVARPGAGNWNVGGDQFSTSQASSPSCSPGTGTYNATQSARCTNPNSGTTVMCFTTNGTTPATNGLGTGCTTGTAYTVAISVTVSETIKIIAGTSTLTDSALVSHVYTLQGSAPTFSPVGGTYASTQTVTISSAESLAMCFTTNGTTPTSNGSGTCSNGSLVSGTVSVSVSETLKAIAMNGGWTDSAVGSAAYTITLGSEGFGTSIGIGINIGVGP